MHLPQRFCRKRTAVVNTVKFDSLKRPFTVNGKPVTLVAVRYSKRRLREGKTQYIYSINGQIYYNENENHAWAVEFSKDYNLVYRRFTTPTAADRKYLKMNGYVLIEDSNPKFASPNHVKCMVEKEATGEINVKLVNQDNVDVSNINEWPNKWPDGIITYKFISHSEDESIIDIQDRALTIALRTIQLRVKNIRFVRVREESKHADIRVEWHHLISVFNNNKGVLAQAYLPANDPRTSWWSGLVQFNDNWDWSPYGENGKQPLLHVLMHELLHSLGLIHDSYSESIMYPFASGKIHFSKRDLKRLQNKYGKRSLSERILNYFMKRRETELLKKY